MIFLLIGGNIPLLHKKGPLAQLVEHLTLNQGVQGSSPWRSTRGRRLAMERVCGLFLFAKNRVMSIGDPLGLRELRSSAAIRFYFQDDRYGVLC